MDKNSTHCKALGCWEVHDFDSKFCAKHGCKACYGIGYTEPLTAVKVRCHVCNGSGESRNVK